MKPRNNRVILTAASALLLAPAAFAGNTWDGGGDPDGNWTNATNWSGNTTPNYASTLTFGGTTNLTTNNNGATSSVVGMTFSSGAGLFTLGGSSVSLGGNIANNSSNVQTVNLPLVLTADRQVATTNANVILGGPISGGFNLIKTAGNTLILNTTGSSFSRLQINAGTVLLGVNEASSTIGGLTFSTSSNATLDLNGKTQTLGQTIVIAGTATGTATISDTAGGGLLKLGDNLLQNSGSLTNVTISAALDLNGATRSFTLGNATTTFNVSGAISNSSGTAGLTKAGVGTLTLSGPNTYNGGTTVSNGTLLVSNTTGSGTGSGAVTVDSGATLGGTGSIAGTVNVSGVLSPGSSIESLGTGTLTLNSGSSLKYEINTDTVGSDLLHVSGGLNIGSNVTLNLTDLASLSEALAVNTKFTLLSYTGAWNSGTFNGYADDSTFLFANNEWRINYNDLTGGSNFTSDQVGATGFVTLTVIPEPSSAMLGLGGLGALLLRRRRFQRTSRRAGW
jgi:MYXO-CTERM domain-containing protein